MPCYVRRANVVRKVKQVFPIFSFSFYWRHEQHPQFNAKECKCAYLAEHSCNTEKQWPVPLNESLFIKAGRQKWKKKSVKIGKALPNSTGLAVHLWLQKALFKFGLFRFFALLVYSQNEHKFQYLMQSWWSFFSLPPLNNRSLFTKHGCAYSERGLFVCLKPFGQLKSALVLFFSVSLNRGMRTALTGQSSYPEPEW